MTEGLWDRSIRHFGGRVLSQAHFRRRRDREHRRILQAIVQRDADGLENAWRDHVYQSGPETVAYLRALAVSVSPLRDHADPVAGTRRTLRPDTRPRGTPRPAAVVSALRPGRPTR